MDPVTAQLLLKGLDLAFVGLNMMARYDEAHTNVAPLMQEVVSLQRQISEGELTGEEAKDKASRLVDALMHPVDEAMARL